MAWLDAAERSIPLYLEPDENVHLISIALGFSPINTVKMVFSETRGVVTTDRRLLVVRTAKNTPTGRVKGILSEHPRTLDLGTPSGRGWVRCDAFGAPLWFPRRGFEQLVRMLAKLNSTPDRTDEAASG